MIPIELTTEAERDLIDIYLYGIKQFGAAQAERYAQRLMQAIETAASHPSFGVDYSFVRAGLRRYEHTSHAIYYERRADRLLVLRILHGRMDPGRHIG